ncbi:hypothetical protein [uncultured Succinivibrio sp.]|uniref:hypothetical protein n=1 Tax=uncultured Succinivibrio sp. TaxID=540749 RepID=UPI0025D67AFB|nr:hypothetical protein [uncultured Succinivibrio sp.]
MSDIALSNSNRSSDASIASSVNDVAQKNKIDEIAGQVVDELWDKSTSLDKFEELSTEKKPSKLGRIMARIAGGILLGAGLVAAAAATVVSLGVAPAVIAAAATAIGGIAGTSIAAGVTGLAGIGCLAGSFVGGRSAEAFVEGQKAKNSTDDNLALITNGNVGGVQSKADNEKFFGLSRSFAADIDSIADNYELIEKTFNFGPLYMDFFGGSGAMDLIMAVDSSDPKSPKLVKGDKGDAFKTEMASDFVEKVITMCGGKSLEFSKENIALVRHCLGYLVDEDRKTFLADKYKNAFAFTNEKFVNQISSVIQDEMNQLKDSGRPTDQEKYIHLSIFKAALRLSDADIERLEKTESKKSEQNLAV